MSVAAIERRPRTKPWLRDEIIGALLSWRALHGRWPGIEDWRRADPLGRWPSFRTVIRRFGGWLEAQRVAGRRKPMRAGLIDGGAVLNHLHASRTDTMTKDVALALGIPHSSALTALLRLERDGKVIRVNNARWTLWRVTAPISPCGRPPNSLYVDGYALGRAVESWCSSWAGEYDSSPAVALSDACARAGRRVSEEQILDLVAGRRELVLFYETADPLLCALDLVHLEQTEFAPFRLEEAV